MERRLREGLEPKPLVVLKRDILPTATNYLDPDEKAWIEYKDKAQLPFTVLQHGSESHVYTMIPKAWRRRTKVKELLHSLRAEKTGPIEDFIQDPDVLDTIKFEAEACTADSRAQTATEAEKWVTNLSARNVQARISTENVWYHIEAVVDYEEISGEEGGKDSGLLKLPDGPTIILPLSSGEKWYLTEKRDKIILRCTGSHQEWEIDGKDPDADGDMTIKLYERDDSSGYYTRTEIHYVLRYKGSTKDGTKTRVRFPLSVWEEEDTGHMMVALPSERGDKLQVLNPLHHIHNPDYSLGQLQAIMIRNGGEILSDDNRFKDYLDFIRLIEHSTAFTNLSSKASFLLEMVQQSVLSLELSADDRQLAEEALMRISDAFRRVGLLN